MARLLFLDFETYYDQQYSLRKMTPPEYILHPNYETIMCAVQEERGAPYVVDGPDFPEFLKKFPAEDTITVTFNALFDNAILAWRYGYVPKLMLDAMGMARALRGHILPRANLATVMKTLGLGEKGDYIGNMAGKNREALKTLDMWKHACDYAKKDVRGAADIYYLLEKEFPESERRIMDMVIRACVSPKFVCDVPMLETHKANLLLEKQGMLWKLGMNEASSLLSSKKFAELLREQGIEPAKKTSLTGNEVYAFAKSDAFMQNLLEHDNHTVQLLAAARLGVKSTIEETRTDKFIKIGSLPWPSGKREMPIPLGYGKTHTHRLAGEWKMNPQNMPANRGAGRKSRLRKSLTAPEHHSVIAADLGQIEARVSAWLCGCHTLLDQFRNKKDPYNLLGTAIFGFPVDRKVHIIEGFIGKTGILGLSYGCGPDRFYSMVTSMARMSDPVIDLTGKFDVTLAEETVRIYREEMYPQMPKGWRKLDNIIRDTWAEQSAKEVQFGPCVISKGEIMLPGGLPLRYANPECAYGQEHTYTYGNDKVKIKMYGAKMLENITQALSRMILMNAALRIKQRTGFSFQLQAHDELVYVVPNNVVDLMKTIVHTEMTRAPTWAPDLPLKADVNHGPTYGDAK